MFINAVLDPDLFRTRDPRRTLVVDITQISVASSSPPRLWKHNVTWCVVSHIVCRDPHLCVCPLLYILTGPIVNLKVVTFYLIYWLKPMGFARGGGYGF